ncbi:MAG: hypothetical protein LBJ14_04490 [Desulfarculales bacterium]|jgi:hypothetical protein|nr:hypothetical protein [Desulfarculales bacterium]
MTQWDVTIEASKDGKILPRERWVERVSAVDIIAARTEAVVKARQKKPYYLLYETTTILEVKI